MKTGGEMPMYYGAKPKLFGFASRMRKSPTDAEAIMWRLLTSADFQEYKFRRQHPIFRFIADFYSHSLLLVVEIDGGYHTAIEQKELDAFRDEDMNHLGITVVRFTNDEVVNHPQTIMKRLHDCIEKSKR